MAAVRILSAGAAQAVVEPLMAAFKQEGHDVKAEFSAVGAMKARLLEGVPADLIILSGAMIDELIAAGQVVAGSRADLGRVGTGVAVRAGTPLPNVKTTDALRGSLLAAKKIVCPDPGTATAGKVVMSVLERMGIAEQARPRLQFFPNGYAAMSWLAESHGTLEVGITQNTEIKANKGVTYVGPLPDELQMKTIYSAGLCARAQDSDTAKSFLVRLTGPANRPALEAAGYEFDR
ncbi:MAG: substrate-binding domain-containing protein [Betaproteobacteria bacterium]|nr:substrate-binding domain-containing protein [Betaproteobacteria bacterium]